MNKLPSIKTIKSLCQEYPEGTIVIFDKTTDVHAPTLGTAGEVFFVDDIGTILVD